MRHLLCLLALLPGGLARLGSLHPRAQELEIDADAFRSGVAAVRFEAGGVVGNLTEVRDYQPNQSRPLKRERFSATLPPDWYAYTPADTEKEGKTNTYLIAPTATVNARVEAGPLEPILEEHDSPSAWLESALEQLGKRLNDFSLRDQGVETVTIGNRNAAVAVFDFLDGGQPKTARGITLFGDSSAVNLRFMISSDEFQQWQPEIEEILAGLQVD